MKDSRQSEGSSLMLVLLVMFYRFGWKPLKFITRDCESGICGLLGYILLEKYMEKIILSVLLFMNNRQSKSGERKDHKRTSPMLRMLWYGDYLNTLVISQNCQKNRTLGTLDSLHCYTEHRTREQFQLDVSLQENESSQLVLHLLVGRCTERGLEGRLTLLDVESIEYVNDLDDESCLGPSAEEILEQCTASVMKPHDCATDMSYKDHKQCSQLYMSDSRLGGIISHSDEYPSNLSSAENDDSSCAEVSAERTYVSTETTNCDCTAKNGYTEQQEYCEHCGAELRQDHLKPQSTDYLSVRSCGENEIPDGEVAANEETIRASCVTCEVGEWLESNVHKQDPKHHKGLHPHEKINNCAFPTNPVCPKSAAKVIESNCESLVRDIYPHKISNDMSEDKVSKAPLEVMTVPPYITRSFSPRRARRGLGTGQNMVGA